MNKQEKINEKKISWSTIVYAALVFIIAYFTIVGLLIFFSPTLTGKFVQNRTVLKTSEFFPYPVAMVGGKFITEQKLLSNLASVQRFYENQDFSKIGLRVDFSTTDGKKRLELKGREIFDKLIEDKIIQSEAKKKGIVLTSAMVDQEVDRLLKEYGTGESLRGNLDKLYGWDLDDFKENIVKPDLYREKMVGYIQENDPSFSKAKSKIEEAQKDLKKGMDFSDVVGKYSDGESATQGGVLGWFSLDQMLPEVASVVSGLSVGQQSEIIQSGVGYHIVKVENKKTENDIVLIEVSQIFARTGSFSDWLREAEKDYYVYVFLREFQWDSATQSLQFKSNDLRKYEQNMKDNPPNDPSVIF